MPPKGMNEKMSVNPKTGVVHIPVVHRSEPGHPKGSFNYKDNQLAERPGRHLQMNPGKEDVWVLYTLPGSFLGKKPKRFTFSMRFQTNQAQATPLLLEIRQGNKNSPNPIHTLEIPLPNTENQWTTLDPIPLDVPIGGALETHLKFVHAQPQGMGICIRDFTLSPVGATSSGGEYSIEWFSNWLDTLTRKIQETIVPTLDETIVKTFQEACQLALEANQRKEANKDEKQKEKVHREYTLAMDACVQAALPLYEGSIDPKLASVDWKSAVGKELLQAIAIAHGTPSDLAAYAAEGPTQRNRLHDLLHHPNDLLYQMILHGGPRGGDYGSALDIHHQIEAKRNQQHPKVLSKLSLAVALEFAQPLQAFQQPSVFIDPMERYLHYEQAYLEGELDEYFEDFSVWELRMVVNSDAPNDQLTWFRNMIRIYQPDVAAMEDYTWRYSWIVRTDVYYKDPDWKRLPHDYPQIVSGGGKCGPRAWMGRMACRAFGCPTWNCKQPGHAAMARWTPTGWVTQLGGGFRVSWWDNPHRDGLDFECETKVRERLGDDQYLKQVALLDWIGVIRGQSQNATQVNPKEIWPSLGIVQRRRLSAVDQCEVKKREIPQCEIVPRCKQFQQRTNPKECITQGDDGSIIIPISCRASANGPKNFMKSFCDNGMQCFVKPGWDMTFKIPNNLLPEKKAYTVSLRFTTVHETDTRPFLLSVTHGSNKEEIELPYEMKWQDLGKWMNTTPVKVELGGSQVVLNLTKKEERHPCTLKDIRLTPC